MNNNTNEIYEQLENGESAGEIDDKELVLELLEFSALPLLYITENRQKDIAFNQRFVKKTGWQLNGVCLIFAIKNKELRLDAIKLAQGFRFFKCRWRKDE